MAKFYGGIGYGETVETRPGVFVQQITEYQYFGDVIRNSRKLDNGDKVNNDISVGNSISIVADAYAREHFFAMLYIRWMGAAWLVSDVEVKHPRLILRLGGVYNGPTAEVTQPTPDNGG